MCPNSIQKCEAHILIDYRLTIWLTIGVVICSIYLTYLEKILIGMFFNGFVEAMLDIFIYLDGYYKPFTLSFMTNIA